VLRIPLLQGRIWDESETIHGSKLAIINQTLARQYFPNGDAVGSEIRVPELKGEPPFRLVAAGSDSWFQVIGVVGDARNDGLRNPTKPSVYVPYTVSMPVWTQILVRTKVPPLTILRSVREQIHSVDPDQQAFRDVSRSRWLDQNSAGMGTGTFWWRPCLRDLQFWRWPWPPLDCTA